MRSYLFCAHLMVMAACQSHESTFSAPITHKKAAEEADQAPAAQPLRGEASIAAGGAAGIGAVGGMGVGKGTADMGPVGKGTVESAPSPRAWYPQTFLFEPRVTTGAAGTATVTFRIPDRLTTWRILGLAHARSGAQAGALARVVGTLPAYVDPIVPSFLAVGDDVRLPVQVVNTAAAPLTRMLNVTAEGARVYGEAVHATLSVPAHGHAIVYLGVHAERPGEVHLKASFGDVDAIVRRFPVHPLGRPLRVERGGTLAAPRALELTLAPGLDATAARVQLVVFPGALAVLRSELLAAPDHGGLAADAYGLLLAGRGGDLIRALGGEPDVKALRALALISAQRALRDVHDADLPTSTLLIEPALSHRDNPVLERLGECLAAQLASSQHPDGTFGGGNGWALQRVLVATADGIRALQAAAGNDRGRQRALMAAVRADGAFERLAERVVDPYTASAILTSGVVKGGLESRLRTRVRAALIRENDGTWRLPLDPGVLRADGTPPSLMESTARAALALLEDREARTILPDLGAHLMSGYRPDTGFGDPQSSLLALRAVVALFKDSLPPEIRIVLKVDGQVAAERDLSGRALRQQISLESGLSRGGTHHSFDLEAKPAVPGLGFALTILGYGAWSTEPPEPGLDLVIDQPKSSRVGDAAAIRIAAQAPAGRELEIRHALPAGVAADEHSLAALVSDGTIRHYTVEDGTIVLDVPARTPGQGFSATYRVIPTLAGRVHAGASSIAVTGLPVAIHHAPPVVWTVR